MPVWRRYLVREAPGRLVELPSRAFDRADDGTAPIPGLAGRCVDLVSAVLVGEPSGGTRLTEVAFTKLYFDSSGFVDAGKRERMIRLMLESCADARRPAGSPGAAAAVRAGEARLQLAAEFGWRPAPAEVSEVMHRLDPIPGAAPRTLH